MECFTSPKALSVANKASTHSGGFGLPIFNLYQSLGHKLSKQTWLSTVTALSPDNQFFFLQIAQPYISICGFVNEARTVLPKWLDLTKPKISFKAFKNKHQCICVKKVIYSLSTWICETISNHMMRVIEKLRTGRMFAANDTLQAGMGRGSTQTWLSSHTLYLTVE